jgi:DNA replication protein DnaC
VEFHDAWLANYREDAGNRTALRIAHAFVANSARDLFLTGGVGAGKTRLACSIANDLFARGKGVRFVRVPLVLHQLQPGVDSETRDQLELQLFRTPILVLDDLGAERDMATDYTRRTLLLVYEERGDRGLRTIFTSNKALQQLGDMQDDDRLASRIAGRADVVQLTSSDQRLARRVKQSGG